MLSTNIFWIKAPFKRFHILVEKFIFNALLIRKAFIIAK